MEIKWGSFKKEKGWEGLNNAAINTFKSNVISSFVRENIQNSNDARQKDKKGKRKKLRVEIEYTSVDREVFPEYEEFIRIFKSIAAEKNNIQHKLFFKNALQLIEKENKIPVLIYRDFNTIGLSGSDEDASSSFNACVLSEGQSVQKDSDSGGSYGIGKNSIFAISKIRTVLYSSFNEERETIIQGVAKLASYRQSGTTYESRVYFGKGLKLSSIRNSDLDFLNLEFKNFFHRNELGLSQFAFCPELPPHSTSEFIKAILKNYWPLLINDELEVDLKFGGKTLQKVSSYNLDELMNKYYSPENYDPDDSEPAGNPFDYYNCYKDNQFKTEKIHMLDSMNFYCKELEHKKTNHILYIRHGMAIKAEPIWGFGSIGYCGVVECINNEGNSLLRMMEPPEHNRFDPSRLNEKSEKYKTKDGDKAFKEIKASLRTTLREILDKYRNKAEDIPWLNNLIQSIAGLKGAGAGNRTGTTSTNETPERIPFVKTSTVAFDSAKTNSWIRSVDGEPKGNGKENGNMAGKGSVKGAGSRGGSAPPGTTKLKKIEYRIFRLMHNNQLNHVYKVIIRGDEENKIKSLKILQSGDSGNVVSFELIDVRNRQNKSVPFSEVKSRDGDITAYLLESVNIPDELMIEVKEPYKSSFIITEN